MNKSIKNIYKLGLFLICMYEAFNREKLSEAEKRVLGLYETKLANSTRNLAFIAMNKEFITRKLKMDYNEVSQAVDSLENKRALERDKKIYAYVLSLEKN